MLLEKLSNVADTKQHCNMPFAMQPTKGCEEKNAM